MRNLLVFLVRHYFFLLFLGLEVVAVWMLVSSNYLHRSSMVNTANSLTGGILTVRDDMVDYFNLREKNKQLADQNALLLAERKSSYVAFVGKTVNVKDTVYKQRYTYIPAKVIDNTVNRRKNIITLNCGRAQGVQEKQGVIGPNGVVGFVRDVSENFCTVMSVLHDDAQVGTKLKADGNFGMVRWEVSDDYAHATLNDLASHAKLHKGDTLITSGFGETFPEGIIVGYVETFGIPSGENFFRVKLKLGTDFKTLGHVYVVRDLMKEEIAEVQNKTAQEDARK